MGGKWKSSSCPPPCLFHPRHNLFSRDRMLSDSHAACVVNGIRNRARYASDARFAEALDAIKPSGLQAIDEQLRHFRDIHDGRQPIRKIANAVVPGAWKLSIPRNGIGCDLCA